MDGAAGVHRGGGGGGKKGKKRKRQKEGGIFWVLGELLVRTPEEAEAHLRAALKERDNGDHGDDGDDEGDKGDNKGEGGDYGGERKGTRGVRRGLPGAKMRPGNPPARRRDSLRVATRDRGLGGQGG